jgi:hypothetical protein
MMKIKKQIPNNQLIIHMKTTMKNKPDTLMKRSRLSSLSHALGILSIPALAAPLSAATIFSVLARDGSNNYQAPAGPTLVDNLLTGSSSSGNIRNISANRDNAQTFTTTTVGTIDKIAINFGGFSSVSTTPLVFELFRTVNATDNLPASPVLIDSLSFTAADMIAALGSTPDSGTLVFDVVDTSAAIGDTFAFRFNSGAGFDAFMQWGGNNLYADGDYFEGNTPRGEGDRAFAVMSVPEPSSAALIGLGGLALILRRRK